MSRRSTFSRFGPLEAGGMPKRYFAKNAFFSALSPRGSAANLLFRFLFRFMYILFPKRIEFPCTRGAGSPLRKLCGADRKYLSRNPEMRFILARMFGGQALVFVWQDALTSIQTLYGTYGLQRRKGRRPRQKRRGCPVSQRRKGLCWCRCPSNDLTSGSARRKKSQGATLTCCHLRKRQHTSTWRNPH